MLKVKVATHLEKVDMRARKGWKNKWGLKRNNWRN